MSEFKDFDLGLVDSSNNTMGTESTQITSYSLCTPGCKTGILQGCSLKSTTCKCTIVSSSI